MNGLGEGTEERRPPEPAWKFPKSVTFRGDHWTPAIMTVDPEERYCEECAGERQVLMERAGINIYSPTGYAPEMLETGEGGRTSHCAGCSTKVTG